MRKKSKLILTGLMTAGTAVSLVSTTYAFVILNKQVEVDEFDFKLASDSGLLISLDGESFSQDITTSAIKKQILINAGAEEADIATSEKIDKAYEDLAYSGVTLKVQKDGATKGNIILDDNGYPSFTHDYEKLIEDKSKVSGDVRYTHEPVDATSMEYIMFDLYFRVQNSGDSKSTYNLCFSDRTKMTGGESSTIAVQNDVTTMDGTLKAQNGDTITVNPIDAMRIGVINQSVTADKKSMIIYEPTLGLGSAAVEGRTDKEHNKDMNAMYTYYNSIHPFSPFTEAAIDGNRFDTINGYSRTTFSYTENALGTFKYDSEKEEYPVIQLTIAIWLEGWDADYFLGIPESAKDFSVYLGFEMKEA